MHHTTTRTILAAVAALALGAATDARAQLQWCCANPAHAGGTAQERCDLNKQTFAKVEECAAHKADHDANTGHKSTCSTPVAQTRKGTAGGGSRAVGGGGGGG